MNDLIEKGGGMKKHGDITLEWDGNVLISCPKGPFNPEGTIDTIQRYQQCVLDANLSCWFRLEIWDDETMGSPQAMEKVKDAYPMGN